MDGRQDGAGHLVRSSFCLSPASCTSFSHGSTIFFSSNCRSTADPPSEITNPNGMLVLRTTNGFVQGDGGLAQPLAGNFSLFDGKASVQVPDVPARDDYQVVCKFAIPVLSRVSTRRITSPYRHAADNARPLFSVRRFR